MKKILTYGSFDILHWGHVALLKRARELGDYLVVGLSTDQFNIEKGKRSIFPYERRETILKAVRYVDEVIPESNWEQKVTDVRRYNAAVFVMGDDWQGKFDFLTPYCEVVYLPRTQDISTTQLKAILKRI